MQIPRKFGKRSIKSSNTKDPKKLSNKFNNYFINVAKKLLEDNCKANIKYEYYLKNSNEHSLYLKETESKH